MDKYATTTKPEGQSTRANVRDLFPKQSKTSSEQDANIPADPNVSRL